MTAARTIGIGLCGLGTVGQGVWKHFGRMRPELESRLGARIVLRRAAVRNPSRARGVSVPPSKLTGDAMAVATDPAIQIVCELIGGTGIAREVTLAALARGKIVVSANKALICAHGAEIFAAARRHGGHFLFEASVAGGIPLIKAVREGLVANRFPRIYGILNGTCNYILTRMEELDAPYASVLKEAKRLGYAEKEESLDVEGGTPRTRPRSSRGSPRDMGAPGADDRRGDRPHHPRRLQERRRAGLRHQAPWHHHARLCNRRDRCARSPDAPSQGQRARARERGLQRDLGHRGRRRHHALHRARRGAGCHRERRHQRHSGRGRASPARQGRPFHGRRRAARPSRARMAPLERIRGAITSG